MRIAGTNSTGVADASPPTEILAKRPKPARGLGRRAD